MSKKEYWDNASRELALGWQPVCSECGSSDVVFNGEVCWDVDEQKFALKGKINTGTICNGCGEVDVSTVWKPITGDAK